VAQRGLDGAGENGVVEVGEDGGEEMGPRERASARSSKKKTLKSGIAGNKGLGHHSADGWAGFRPEGRPMLVLGFESKSLDHEGCTIFKLSGKRVGRPTSME
jgi:hypothetical protein